MEIILRQEAKTQGLRFYFTGKPCKRGHVTRRYVSTLNCEKCSYELAIAWQRNNQERAKEAQRASHQRHKQKNNLISRQYHEHHRVTRLAQQKRWHARNKEKANERSRAWKAKNKEHSNSYNHTAKRKAWLVANRQRISEWNRQWKLDHPDQVLRNRRVHKHRRRSRERNATGTFNANDLTRLFSAQSGCCVYCKDNLGRKYHVDHIVPLSKGGSNDPANLQLLCASCNLSKAARDPIVYAQSLGMLL